MNEERKKRYLEYRDKMFQGEDTVESQFVRLFEQIAPFEKRLNKDCAEFIEPEILDFFKYLNTTSVATLRNKQSQFAGYTDWCISERLAPDNQDHYRAITIDQLAQSVNKIASKNLYLTKEDVYELCNSTNSYREKAVILGLYEGIKGENLSELINLRREDLKENNRIYLKDRGKEVVVSPRLYQYFKEAADEMTITYQGNARNRTTYFLSSEKDKVIKLAVKSGVSFNPEDVMEARIRIYRIGSNAIKNYSGLMDLRGVRLQSIYESGILNFIFERSEQLNMAPMEYFNSPLMIEEVKERFQKRIVRSLFLSRYQNYLE